ncbi:MAG: aspartate carbamoyltransferase catalytic subunit [Parvularculaceae bacterium]
MESAERPAPPTGGFAARRLISVDDLSDADVAFLISLAEHYAGHLRRGARPPQRLAGKTQINLFYEDSTRTNLSFDLAGKKLGADVLNVPVAASSVNKEESFIDTCQTLAAMGAHAMIVRHPEPRVHETLADRLTCAVLNAGDGAREHPTQALLDAATIKSAHGRIEGLTVAIIGDVRHSRVAGSDARLLLRLGAKVRFVGPAAMMPAADDYPGVERFDDLRAGLEGADVAMALRLQRERMDADAAASAASGFFDAFGLTHASLEFAKPGAFAMHPGPVNRGVEIDGELVDDPDRSLVARQVFFGVAMRMACLDALLTRGRSEIADIERSRPSRLFE